MVVPPEFGTVYATRHCWAVPPASTSACDDGQFSSLTRWTLPVSKVTPSAVA